MPPISIIRDVNKGEALDRVSTLIDWTSLLEDILRTVCRAGRPGTIEKKSGHQILTDPSSSEEIYPRATSPPTYLLCLRKTWSAPRAVRCRRSRRKRRWRRPRKGDFQGPRVNWPANCFLLLTAEPDSRGATGG